MVISSLSVSTKSSPSRTVGLDRTLSVDGAVVPVGGNVDGDGDRDVDCDVYGDRDGDGDGDGDDFFLLLTISKIC